MMRTLSVFLLALSIGVPNAAGNIIVGNAVIDRPFDSIANPGDIVYDVTTGLITADGFLASWSFFDNDNQTPDRVVTPMIIRDQSGVFSITGIGQTRTTTENGLQTHAFDLQSGSDAVFNDGTYFFGFRHGTADGTTTNSGVVDLATPATSPPSTTTSRFFAAGSNPTPVGVISNSFNTSEFGSTYSYSGTIIPEPSTLLCLGWAGISVAMMTASRGRRSRNNL